MHGPYLLSPDCESQCITTWANPYFCILKSFMNLLKSCITTRPIITITMRWYLGRVGGHRAVLLPWFSDHSISNPAEVSSFIQCNCKKGIKERQKMTIAYL